MRTFVIAGALLLLIGCQNVVGPFRAQTPVRVDDPRLTIDEQERLARARLALPEYSATAVPPLGTGQPGLDYLNRGH